MTWSRRGMKTGGVDLRGVGSWGGVMDEYGQNMVHECIKFSKS